MGLSCQLQGLLAFPRDEPSSPTVGCTWGMPPSTVDLPLGVGPCAPATRSFLEGGRLSRAAGHGSPCACRLREHPRPLSRFCFGPQWVLRATRLFGAAFLGCFFFIREMGLLGVFLIRNAKCSVSVQNLLNQRLGQPPPSCVCIRRVPGRYWWKSPMFVGSGPPRSAGEACACLWCPWPQIQVGKPEQRPPVCRASLRDIDYHAGTMLSRPRWCLVGSSRISGLPMVPGGARCPGTPMADKSI